MLYRKILNKLDEQRGLSDKLAPIAGYKSGQALRKSLKENREFGSFYGLVNLVKELFPNDELKLMSEYAMTLDPNKQTARYMLEYCELNKLIKTKEFLMNKMLNCSNAQSKEWAELYYADKEYTEGRIDFLEAIDKFGYIKSKSIEIMVISSLLRAYVYLDKQMYDMAFHLVYHLSNKFDCINEIYIRNQLKGRYLLIMAEYYMRKGNLEETRKTCEEIIETVRENNPIKCFALLQLGNSYVFESYETSNKFLLQGLKLAEEKCFIKSTVNLQRSLNFLDNFWKKLPRYLDLNSNHPSDVHEVVFSLINKAKVQEATVLLEKENLNEITDNQKAFHYYLKGLISKNIKDFYTSLRYFKLSGDVFFRELVIIEFRKMNLDNDLVETLRV